MSKRARWKPRVCFLAILVVGIVALCLFIGKIRERKEFISKIDGVSGYRCRFTLAAGWSQEAFLPPPDMHTDMRAYEFTSPRVHATLRWVYNRLYSQETSPPSTVNMGPGTLQMSIVLRIFPGKSQKVYGYSLSRGYPEPILEKGERILTCRHLMIDECPATLFSKEWMTPYRREHLTLLVSTPDHKMLYEVGDFGRYMHIDDFDHEIETITASFHVERVKGRATLSPSSP